MSNSHRKRRGRATPPTPAPEQRQVNPTPPASAPEPTGATPPQIEVPVIGPPRRKPARKPAPPGDERPALPSGALVSLMISGGLAFSHRELVVYDDGRVTYATVGAGRGQTQRASHLSDEQLAAVRAEIANLDASAFANRTTSLTSDGYAYEIAARVGGQVAATTVSTGFIPPALAPLLRTLRDLMEIDTTP